MKSKTKKLTAVKERILIRYLGLGWEDAHHPWSKGGVDYTPKQLLKHLTDVVIPLADTLKVPDEPPLNAPCAPTMKTRLGTTIDLSLTVLSLEQNEMKCNIDELRKEGFEERDRREDAGESDRWMEMQKKLHRQTSTNLLKGTRLKSVLSILRMMDQQYSVLQWCPGVVKSIKNKKNLLQLNGIQNSSKTRTLERQMITCYRRNGILSGRAASLQGCLDLEAVSKRINITEKQ